MQLHAGGRMGGPSQPGVGGGPCEEVPLLLLPMVAVVLLLLLLNGVEEVLLLLLLHVATVRGKLNRIF